MKISKREPTVLRFLRTGIAKAGLKFKKQMLIPLSRVKFCSWGESYPAGTIRENRTGVHDKIMIPAQQWFKPSGVHVNLLPAVCQ